MPHAVCAYARKAPAPYPTPRRALFRRGCDGPGGGRRLPGQPAFCSDPDTRGAVFPARAAGRRRRRRGCLWCVCDAYGFILCAGRAREREAYQCVLLLVVVLRLWWSVCNAGGGGGARLLLRLQVGPQLLQLGVHPVTVTVMITVTVTVMLPVSTVL